MKCKCGRAKEKTAKTCLSGSCIEGRNKYLKIETCLFINCFSKRKEKDFLCKHHYDKYYSAKIVFPDFVAAGV